MKSLHVKFILISLCLVFSCKKDKGYSEDNIFKFREYISFTTTGVNSVKSNIVVNLVKPVSNWKADQALDQSFFSISPSVSGSLVANNNHSFVFKPDEDLDVATEYTVRLQLDKLYPKIEDNLKAYTFKFKTKKPNFSVNTSALQSYDKEWQYVLGYLKLADEVDYDKAKQILNAYQDNEELDIVWNESKTSSSYFEFKIDSIHRKVEEDFITLKWNGKYIQSDNIGEEKLNIPGRDNFTVINVEVIQIPEQFVKINFSDPIKKEQNFDGLVTIQNSPGLNFVVDGNVLKVYPETKLSGVLQMDVFQGIENTDLYKLKTTYSESIAFEDIKPEIRLINSGVILPNSRDLKFNFEAVNLKAVDVRVIKIYEDNVLQFLQENNLNSNNKYAIRQVGRRVAKQTITLIDNELEHSGKFKTYSIDLANFFKAERGAIYRVELEYKKEYSLYNCNNQTNAASSNESDDYEDDYSENEIDFENENTDELEEAYWNNLTYRYNNYPYNWKERNNPCHEAYFNEERIVSQNLIASNLGVIVKKETDHTYHFAVSNLLDTKPESGVEVKLYNFQQQEITNATTNTEGIVTIESEHYASFAVVSKGRNVTYVKLDDGNSLSLSNFDVSGSKLQKGLKGFLYTERGVWRPGDTVYLSFMLNDVSNPLPQDHPVKLEVTDPNGKLTYREITKSHKNRLYSFQIPTQAEDKTGNWLAKVSVGGAKFYKTLKVETIKPNRLKIDINFKDEVLSSQKSAKANLAVNWLHGAPAKGVKAEVKVKFTTSYQGFKSYPDYVFTDPTKNFDTEELTVFKGNVNQEGKALVSNNLKVSANTPGLLNAQFLVRAFENGGDFSIDAFTIPYAPYTSFVGLKSPEPKAYGSFYTNENQNFKVAVVDKDGKPVKRDKLEVKVYKIEWRWWWNASEDKLSQYTSSTFHQPVYETTLSTNAKGEANFDINIDEEDSGRYLIRVLDPVSGHATGRTAYFYRNWWKKSTGEDKEASKMLVFTADKEKYNVGETAQISFPSAQDGRALLSIENGSEVVSFNWVKTRKGETKLSIPITKEMAPNVFVNISLLQPHAMSENDLPLRLYGVIPLLVEDASTILEPEIDLPKTLEPESKFTVKVSEKNKKAMTYTLAIVEEGLLDLTRFKTPNPHEHFYAREALGVKTWDMFDDVIGAYSGSIEQIFAIGGDGSLDKGKNKKANRFKPVVTYLGPFYLESGSTKSHEITLPNYIGSVRAMVVASDVENEAYGHAEQTAAVKKPLMVLASVPRKLSPREQVIVPVTVFAMENSIKNVNLSIKTSEGVKVNGSKSSNLTFTSPDEKMAYFTLDVSKAFPKNTIEITASSGREKSSYKVEFEVYNPNPISTKSIEGELESKAQKTMSFKTFGEVKTNSATVEFSTLPPMNFTSRLQYLIRYPHGCVEQTTSSVFPQLFLNNIFDLEASKKQEISKHVKNGISRIGKFQTPNGGLSYWIGESNTDDWGTSYAGHFMLEAEKKGYVLPLTFKNNWIRYQKDAARNWRPSYRNHNSDLAQAYRLYTLALAGEAELSAMNRLREFTEISNEAKWRLAAAYALAGQNEASLALVNTASLNIKAPKHNSYTYGSQNRNKAMALETLVILKDSRARELAKELAKELSSNQWMSTQTTAYSLMALAKMVEANGGKDIHVSYTHNGKKETINTKNAIAVRNLEVVEGVNSLKLNNENDNMVFVRILNSGKLPLGQEQSEQRGLNASIAYKDLKGNPIAISKLKQGQDFVAVVNIRNMKNIGVNHVALSQFFPSGWEIVNTRFTDFGASTSNQARYIDIRDNDVKYYFDLDGSGNGKSKTFQIMLNASYLGKYYLPGLQAEAMYDNDFFVRNRGQWVEVVK
ncbi:alpha-2-macroglobulin family protein [Aurantibacter aestuarii]|uniref:Alpha-2-macroglobulin n=1 Tax=Aurantibacter aestuarii TaxID=1266046 RepID=A0A2T1NDK5_9FLAO|nr:MG2 domain-containing protein [Aurantibacter aestuarii]PSG90523.1 hypothetical protein C7H52_04380 [Aurantibacter aestuarii]